MKTRYARSIRYAALVTMIAATSVVQACSSDTILAVPSVSLPPVTEPITDPTKNGIFGTVTDDQGVVVAGVRVTISRWRTYGQSSSTVTDSMGFYSFPVSAAGGISLLTEKEGYETKWHSRTNPPSSFQFDLRIHRIK
jgi:hypothetical protein